MLLPWLSYKYWLIRYKSIEVFSFLKVLQMEVFSFNELQKTLFNK